MATAADWMSAGLGVTLLCIFLHKGWFFILGTFTDADPLLGPIKSTTKGTHLSGACDTAGPVQNTGASRNFGVRHFI
jgi:hypothetical protein